MKKFFFFIIFFITTAALYSQKEASIWYFGGKAGIRFNDGGTVSVLTDGAINASEGCSTISDYNGNLLFYTDGVTVWDSSHLVMQNGTDLLGADSSTQSAIIMKKPNSTGLYYIFTTGDVGSGGLNYSIVDMSLNGGLGGVTSIKNVELLANSTEKVCIIQHQNQVDFWVIGVDHVNMVLNAYLVNASGVSSVPAQTLGVNSLSTVGYIKGSPDGSKIVLCNTYSNNDAILLDFDVLTGAMSNPQTIYQDGVFYPYGVEFSANGRILYLGTSNQLQGSLEAKVFQFNLTAIDIPLTKTEVFSDSGFILGALQMGINNKIYFKTGSNLSVINNPGILGAGCNVTVESVDLLGRQCRLGLPSFSQSYIKRTFSAQNLCFGSTTQFTLNSDSDLSASLSWDFGDGTTSSDIQPNHQFVAPGLYTVTVSGLPGYYSTATLTVSISESPALASVINDQELCGQTGMQYDLSQFDGVLLGSQSPTLFGVRYFDTLNDLIQDTNRLPVNYTLQLGTKTIFAKVFNLLQPNCYSYTSFDVTLYEAPVLDIHDEYVVCVGDSITIVPSGSFLSYLWSTGSVDPSIVISQAGNYSLTVTTGDLGFVCSTTKNFIVRHSDIAVITDIVVQNLSEDDNIITVYVVGDGDYEYSLDGVNYQNNNFFVGIPRGNYTFFVRDKNGCGVVSDQISILTIPRFFTPNGDGYNEYWQIKTGTGNSDVLVSIFNRFGKLITEFKEEEWGWDGTFNGEKLPADDYWFIVTLENNKKIKGHFALKR